MNLENLKANRIYDELEFVRGLLGTGLTDIRKADIQRKHFYFTAFSSLSIGLERMMKLCLILEYHIRNGDFPTQNEIRNYGHNLIDLFNKIESIYYKYDNEENKLEEIHYRIIKELDGFAQGKGTRYSNINYITSEIYNNPIKNWVENIDNYIWDKYISNKRKDILKIRSDACSIVMQPCITLFISEKDELIEDYNELYTQIFNTQEISGYRVLLLIQIIEYLYQFLNSINKKLDREYHLDDLGRVFGVITYGSDSEKRRRKNFERLF
ncbi:hypothetical protein ACLSZ7_00350 [Avibacterium gallinarum]|uniref:hypothetical protein n=1 Tax=Avibacterium gallinarum TaxID=755 RepID=UPI0039FD601F